MYTEILQDNVCKHLCQLWIKTILLLTFETLYIFSLLYQLHTPVRFWIEVVKVNILFVSNYNGKVFNTSLLGMLILVSVDALY